MPLPAWFMSRGAGGGKGGHDGGVRPASAVQPKVIAPPNVLQQKVIAPPKVHTPPALPQQQTQPKQQQRQVVHGSHVAANGTANDSAPTGGKGKLLALCDRRKVPRAEFVSNEITGPGREWVSSVTVSPNGQPLTFQGSGAKKAAAEEAAADMALLAIEGGGVGGRVGGGRAGGKVEAKVKSSQEYFS